MSQQTSLAVYMLIVVTMLTKMKDFSCHTQLWLSDSIVARHVLNLAAVFFVVVLMTTARDPMHPLLTVGLTFAIYAMFALMTRCDHRFLLAFVACAVGVFFLEACKVYNNKKKNQRQQKMMSAAQNSLQGVGLAFVALGFIVYLGQKSREYRRKWDWRKFIVGVSHCRKSDTLAPSPVLDDFVQGVRVLTPWFYK